MEESLWTLINRTVSQAGGIEKSVLLGLTVMSLASWCIILMRVVALYSAQRNGARFLQAFDVGDSFGSVLNQTHDFGPSPQLTVFKSALHAMESRGRSESGPDPRQVAIRPSGNPEGRVLLAMQHACKAEFLNLQTGLNFLATIGSTTPFIGLFGTVWGIMDTFRALGDAKSASLAVVAPGVSNALIATAAGLAVAIPAVMAYNMFLKRLDDMQESTECFIERMDATISASGWAHAAKASLPVSAPTPAVTTPEAIRPQVARPAGAPPA